MSIKEDRKELRESIIELTTLLRNIIQQKHLFKQVFLSQAESIILDECGDEYIELGKLMKDRASKIRKEIRGLKADKEGSS